MAGDWQPQLGDPVVELWHSGKIHDNDRVSTPTTIHQITQTLIVTADGEKYSRAHMRPVGDRYSHRHLVQITDDRVLCVRGRDALAELARLTANLAAIDRKDPADITAALAQVVVKAADARRGFTALMAEASRTEQASPR